MQSSLRAQNAFLAAFSVWASILGQGATPLCAAQSDVGSVLVVLADDLGIDALESYGLDAQVPRDLTPHLSALASQGIRFENAWSAPKCSPARAALHTGRAAFRTGIGNVIEAGGHSLPTSETTLPEMLALRAPVPYSTGYFGKWHLERTGTNQFCAPSSLHGYEHFAGTLFQVPPQPGYCDWRVSVCDGAVGTNTRSFEYMPARIFDLASAWIATRPERWFCVLAPQAPYELLHTPPLNLQSIRNGPGCASCAPGTRACFDAALQALDKKLGQLLADLGPDWEQRVTVIFTADNGTPGSVNRYWPTGHAKLTLFEGGVRVPFLVAGRAVPAARRGSVSSALVSISDVYRTVARLAGVTTLPAGTAQDSFDLGPLLEATPRANGRTHLWAETFGRNAPAPPYPVHKVAIRDARYKLIYNWSEQRPLFLFDLARDPRELTNLLRPAVPAPNSPASTALQDLTGRIRASLGS